MLLDDNKLSRVEGGFKLGIYGITTLVGGVVTFLVGIFSGYMNPIPCNKWWLRILLYQNTMAWPLSVRQPLWEDSEGAYLQ